MKTKIVFLLALISGVVSAFAQNSVYDFTVNNIEGKPVNLSGYKGKVLLIVNTASKCGLTPQYEGLEALYQKYQEKGFEVLGFPCNQFLGQEPGTAEEIVEFCTNKYNVTFQLFEKTEVNGKHTASLYQYLKAALPLEGKNDIRWNFEKFLIDRTGKPVKRFSPKTKPGELEGEIEKLL
ncbi:MAG: glutathione peroxidase [Paludibacter sp.]|nr:glutathione peroxidase [Paludibacter sp.]